MKIPSAVVQMAKVVRQWGGQMFVVGGAVRDWHMDREPKDIDLLIIGMTEAGFIETFPQAVKALRNNAPVWIVDGFDVALARREISTGQGKNAFEFVADPNMTVEQDLRRRDFTINAMAFDPLRNELIDPFNGCQDIEAKILRPVSDAFVESPERIFRAASFAARFGFWISPQISRFADRMAKDFDTIATEQIWRHFERGLRKAIKPSLFLDVLLVCGWDIHFPELSNMVGLPQDPEWHPEGDVFTHTQMVMDAAPKGDITMQLAALCHDMGKASTTKLENGHWVSPGHAHTQDAADFLDSIGCPEKIKAEVLAIVRCHMDHIGVKVTPRFVKRLTQRVHPANVEKLAALVLADHSGRPPLKAEMPKEMVEILAMARILQINVDPVKPLVMGQHLIQMGHKPGKHFGPILQQAFEAQIEGEFDTLEGGLNFVKTLI